MPAMTYSVGIWYALVSYTVGVTTWYIRRVSYDVGRCYVHLWSMLWVYDMSTVWPMLWAHDMSTVWTMLWVHGMSAVWHMMWAHDMSAVWPILNFDRQIEPRLHYGAAIWSVPRTNNLVYLHNQCGNNSRDIISNLFQQVLGHRIPFVYARKIGRKATGDIENRTILLKVCSYTHKEILLRDHPGPVHWLHGQGCQ